MWFNLHLASGSTDTLNFSVCIITCIDVRIRCKSCVWCFDILFALLNHRAEILMPMSVYRQRCKDSVKNTLSLWQLIKTGPDRPGRERKAGQKVQQPNGEVEGPEGWCDEGKRKKL